MTIISKKNFLSIALDEKMIISKLNIYNFRFGGSSHSFNRSTNSQG